MNAVSHDAETQPSHVPDEWRRRFWACVRVKGQHLVISEYDVANQPFQILLTL